MVEKCALCVANGGRFLVSNYCCRVRKLAEAPKHVRQAAYASVKSAEGLDAVNALIADVNEELQLRRAGKN